MTEFDDLKHALDETAAHDSTVSVFFRDDDADDDLPNLRCLLDTFLERGAPLNLEVIPGTLTSHGADLLRVRHKQAGGLIELNQHGWIHANHEISGRKCEFGPSRNYDRQLEDIERGRDVLDIVFGSDWRPVFTPPWNRCTLDTLRAVNQLGFEALSRDASAAPPGEFGFFEIPITFDIYTWKDGAMLKPAAIIGAELTAQVRAGHRIGILLHHKALTPEGFETLGTLLDIFQRSRAVRMHTFHGMLAGLRKERTLCTA